MRCPSCNKFAGNDLQEPEVQDGPTVEASPRDGRSQSFVVNASVRVSINAECCGDELKEANFDAEAEGTLEHEEGCDAGDDGLEAEESSCEGTDRSESVNPKTGRPIPYRFQRRFYGFELCASVTCGQCKAGAEVYLRDEVQASGMDELT